MNRGGVATVLEQIASCLELRGENPFRVRAFRGAAKAVRGLDEEPAEALASGSLASTKGIGPATAAIVKQLVEVGTSDVLEDLLEETPAGLLEMLKISGLGVSRIRTIHEKLGLETLTELETAARDGRLAALPGFGFKTAETVLRGIGFLRRSQAFRLCHHAEDEAALLQRALERVAGVQRAIVAGEVRRRSEVVRDLALVVVSDFPASDILKALTAIPGLEEIAGEDERRATLRTGGGMAARIVVTPPANLGAVLAQATGSETHLAQLVAHAGSRGYAFNGAALWKQNTFVPTPDESVLYRSLGLADIPPELREGQDEVVRAAAGTLPVLLERSDLKGFLHCHSGYSDGVVSIEELAVACRDAGYAWIGLTDHSRSAAYAGGLSLEDLQRQWAEIDELNARLSGIRVLKGIESDILADGQLDYDDATLSGFEFVIGSIHARFAMTEAEMTARLLRAMDHPALTILGHLTGRLLLSRNGYPLDLDPIFAKAGAKGIAIEINADPHRLDLDWRLLRKARAAGVMISIGADAHNVAGLAYMHYGVGVARKGWLTSGDVLNSRGVDDFLAFARARRA